MKINYGDTIEAFQDGKVIIGKKTGDGPKGICVDFTKRVDYDNILKVNGEVFTTGEVLPEKPITSTQSAAMKVAADCDAYIKKLYPDEDSE